MSAELLRAIVGENRYMVLGTADAAGRPWVSPVWFATEDARVFFWVSSPDARHSRNLDARPQVSLAIFDSAQAPGTGRGVYVAAEAAEVGGEELDDGVRVFARRSAEQGLRAWTREEVLPPARHRLYRALATEHFVLDDHDVRVPVQLA